LPRHSDWDGVEGVVISCTKESGMGELTAAICDELSLGAASWGQEAVAVNARHQDCLRRASEALGVAREQLARGESPEFAAVDLRLALEAIGEVAGKVETEELLGEIFGRFCIGK
ncbi:MAG: tRNA uridine-5-carboxymethylaminomethyl(34) synthesis GTPase MnmE, partial [Roseibacillus sp.]